MHPLRLALTALCVAGALTVLIVPLAYAVVTRSLATA